MEKWLSFNVRENWKCLKNLQPPFSSASAQYQALAEAGPLVLEQMPNIRQVPKIQYQALGGGVSCTLDNPRVGVSESPGMQVNNAPFPQVGRGGIPQSAILGFLQFGVGVPGTSAFGYGPMVIFDHHRPWAHRRPHLESSPAQPSPPCCTSFTPVLSPNNGGTPSGVPTATPRTAPHTWAFLAISRMASDMCREGQRSA